MFKPGSERNREVFQRKRKMHRRLTRCLWHDHSNFCLFTTSATSRSDMTPCSFHQVLLDMSLVNPVRSFIFHCLLSRLSDATLSTFLILNSSHRPYPIIHVSKTITMTRAVGGRWVWQSACKGPSIALDSLILILIVLAKRRVWSKALHFSSHTRSSRCCSYCRWCVGNTVAILQ